MSEHKKYEILAVIFSSEFIHDNNYFTSVKYPIYEMKNPHRRLIEILITELLRIHLYCMC
jgi:hypothetical protein